MEEVIITKSYHEEQHLFCIHFNSNKQFDEVRLQVEMSADKAKRQKRKEQRVMDYKQSRQMCNLYVKNFPGKTTQEELLELFTEFGAINHIKLRSSKDKLFHYALIFFSTAE